MLRYRIVIVNTDASLTLPSISPDVAAKKDFQKFSEFVSECQKVLDKYQKLSARAGESLDYTQQQLF